ASVVAATCRCSHTTAAPTAALCALSLHDALPILPGKPGEAVAHRRPFEHGPPAGGKAERRRHVEQASHPRRIDLSDAPGRDGRRSEEHTSELQSRENLVCRLLLEKKNRTPPERMQ